LSGSTGVTPSQESPPLTPCSPSSPGTSRKNLHRYTSRQDSDFSDDRNSPLSSNSSHSNSSSTTGLGFVLGGDQSVDLTYRGIPSSSKITEGSSVNLLTQKEVSCTCSSSFCCCSSSVHLQPHHPLPYSPYSSHPHDDDDSEGKAVEDVGVEGEGKLLEATVSRKRQINVSRNTCSTQKAVTGKSKCINDNNLLNHGISSSSPNKKSSASPASSFQRKPSSTANSRHACTFPGCDKVYGKSVEFISL